MKVVSTALTDEISVTLLEDTDGWRLTAWTRRGTIIADGLRALPADVLTRRFPDQATALEYLHRHVPLP